MTRCVKLELRWAFGRAQQGAYVIGEGEHECPSIDGAGDPNMVGIPLTGEHVRERKPSTHHSSPRVWLILSTVVDLLVYNLILFNRVWIVICIF